MPVTGIGSLGAELELAYCLNAPDHRTVDALAAIVGRDGVLTQAEDLIPYSFDGTAVLKQRPEAVVFPRSAAQVAECVRLAVSAGVPIVTRGSGTGLSGGSVPSPGSLVLCLAQMNAILDVDARNLTLRAQPGAITQRIDEAAAKHGLFYPPDPGSMRISTIGGNVAENSGGLRGLKYGVTRDYVMGLEVVLRERRDRPFRQPMRQGRRRLLAEGSVHRVRGHARDHHRGPPQARAASGGAPDDAGALRPD